MLIVHSAIWPTLRLPLRVGSRWPTLAGASRRKFEGIRGTCGTWSSRV